LYKRRSKTPEFATAGVLVHSIKGSYRNFTAGVIHCGRLCTAANSAAVAASDRRRRGVAAAARHATSAARRREFTRTNQ